MPDPDCDTERVPQEDAVYELESVGKIDGEVDTVPEFDCDKECVPHGDAVKETDALTDRVANDDKDGSAEPDALSDQLFELQPDGEYELVSVDEIVGDVDTVPDTD